MVQYGGHNYATALMVTMVPEVVIKPPWKAFLIELPTDLLFTTDSDGTPLPLTHTLVHQHDLLCEDGVTILEGWILFLIRRRALSFIDRANIGAVEGWFYQHR